MTQPDQDPGQENQLIKLQNEKKLRQYKQIENNPVTVGATDRFSSLNSNKRKYNIPPGRAM